MNNLFLYTIISKCPTYIFFAGVVLSRTTTVRIAATTATISWSSGDSCQDVTHYMVFLNTTREDPRLFTNLTTVHYIGLKCNTNYVVFVTAVDEAGNTIATSDITTFKTDSLDNISKSFLISKYVL